MSELVEALSTGNLPRGHNSLLFSTNGTASYMPSRTDTDGHTKAFICPVIKNIGTRVL